MAKRDKKSGPTWKTAPSVSKGVTIPAFSESSEKQTPAWQFHRRDRDHDVWGWDKLSHQEFCAIVHELLANFETMTWAEILRATGDKRMGNLHHNVSVARCSKAAQQRLMELKADDLDEIFSLRINNMHRL